MNKRLKFLTSLFSGNKEQVQLTEFDARIAPDEPLFVIGDVHGCAEQLDALLKLRPADATLIFVGDIVDRGPSVKTALTRVYDECQNGAICLMGNHEKMMIEFIKDPSGRAKRWLRFGGLQTVYSFKVPRVAERNAAEDLIKARNIFVEALGQDLLSWVNGLPLVHQSGNVHVVHAAADPDKPMSAQEPATLLWGHKNFAKQNRSDDQWVCHGHTIVEEAVAQNGRISIDTGAYATHRLTAALIAPDDISFLTV